MAGEISEDGKWMWDGAEWQPVVSSRPSAPPTTTALPSVQEEDSELVSELKSELEAVKAEIVRKEKKERLDKEIDEALASEDRRWGWLIDGWGPAFWLGIGALIMAASVLFNS